MTIPRGTLATLKDDLRTGIQNELKVRVVMTVNSDGSPRQSVEIFYGAALKEVILTLLEVLINTETNATAKTRLTFYRDTVNNWVVPN